MLSMDKVSKKKFGRITEYFCAKNLTSGFVQVSESFFLDRCTLWRKRRWNSLYGHFSRKERVCTCIEQSESERAPINAVQSAGWQHGPRSERMSLKKCVFGCEGKITLFSFPKQPTVTWTVDIVCFSGAAMEFLKCFVDERFINKAQFDAGFAHRLILKDGAVPAIKGPGHDSELQMVSETASNDCFVGNRSKCSSLFSSAHTARLQELGFFRRGS